MKKVWLYVYIGIALGSALQAAPTFVSDVVEVDTYLLTTLIGPYQDTVTWSHDNPFWGVGDYEETMADNGILGVDLVVTANDISAWDDNVNLTFTDRDGDLHDLGRIFKGVNSFTIEKQWLDGVQVSASLKFDYDCFLDLWDDAKILTSSLIVYYDSDLVSGTPITTSIVPVPGSALLAAIGILGIQSYRKRRQSGSR